MGKKKPQPSISMSKQDGSSNEPDVSLDQTENFLYEKTRY